MKRLFIILAIIVTPVLLISMYKSGELEHYFSNKVEKARDIGLEVSDSVQFILYDSTATDLVLTRVPKMESEETGNDPKGESTAN